MDARETDSGMSKVRPGWRSEEEPHPAENPLLHSVASDLGRTILFACAVVVHGVMAVLPDTLPYAYGVAALAVAADTPLALSTGIRGWAFARQLLAALATWSGVLLVTIGLERGGLGASVLDHLGLAWTGLAAVSIAVLLFPRVQAIWAWLCMSFGAAGLMTYLPSQWTETDRSGELILLLALVLSASSIGALAYYVRGMMARRPGWRALLSRLALIAAALGALTLVASTAVGLADGLTAHNQASDAVAARTRSLARSAEMLRGQFTESEFASPTPALKRELSRLGAAADVGLTVFDSKTGRVTVAVRETDSNTSELPTAAASAVLVEGHLCVFRSVTIGPRESRMIGDAARGPSGTFGESPGVTNLDPRAPRAIPLGLSDSSAAAAAHTMTQAPFVVLGGVPDGERFRLVATDAAVDWLGQDTPDENPQGGQLGEVLAPWLFFAFALPCALGLIALDRRDSAKEKLAASEERARLNRDAHDRVYNRLTALANQLAATHSPDAALPPPAEEIRRTLDDLQSILGDGLGETSSRNPQAAASLLSDIREDQGRRWSMEVELEGADALLGVDPKTGWELACIAEEALTNAGRHGHASHALVTLNRSAGQLTLAVADNGRGIQGPFEDGLPRNASGTRGIAQRAAALGGKLEIGTGPGGTTVVATIPLVS